MVIFLYARLQLYPREISKVICILKHVIRSGDISLVLFILKYQVLLFRTQNEIVLLSAAPPVRKTLPFSLLELAPTVSIVYRQFVNNAVALKFCDNTCISMTFPPIWMLNEYHLEFRYNHLSKMNYTILFLSFFAWAGDAYLTEIEWP